MTDSRPGVVLPWEWVRSTAPRFLAALRRTVVPLLLVAVWEVASRTRLGDPLYTPPASEVVREFVTMLRSGELLFNLKASLVRMGIGFPIGVLVAVPLGLLFGHIRWLDRWVRPLFEFIRPLPSITLIPVVILLLGVGNEAKVALVAYACFWPLFMNSHAGVRDIQPIYIDIARNFEIDGFTLFRKVIVPAAMPHVVVGIRVALALSVIVLLVSEMLGANSGIGFLIVNAEDHHRIAEMFVGIATMAMVGFILYLFSEALERVMIPGHE